uniref:Protein kinase domain-containing protein n=1 Tax=Rhabditophanes sp. KR3021 TaxID=114890 RepID=A0AC35TI15_9BILA
MSPDRGSKRRYDSPSRDHRRSDRERREHKHKRSKRDHSPDRRSRHRDNGRNGRKYDGRRDRSCNSRSRSYEKKVGKVEKGGRFSRIDISTSPISSADDIHTIKKEGTLGGEISKQISSRTRSRERKSSSKVRRKRSRSSDKKKAPLYKSTSKVIKEDVSSTDSSLSPVTPPRYKSNASKPQVARQDSANNVFSIPPPPPPPPSMCKQVVVNHPLPSGFKPIAGLTAISPPPPPPPGHDRSLSPMEIEDLPPPPPSRKLKERPIIYDHRVTTITSRDWGMDTENNYKIEKQVGEGTYGFVFKATQLSTGQEVALKRVRLENEKEGFPITAIREIIILRQLDHKNVVRLMDIVTNRSVISEKKKQESNEKGRTSRERNDDRENIHSFYLVFEYLDHDLVGLLDSDMEAFTELQVASFMKQLAEGLRYCHKRKFLHRDIKGSNILFNNRGEIKLADFGLARFYDRAQSRLYTNRVITLWYRPPELLLGSENYDEKIDCWSLGCILPEMFIRKPVFAGNTELVQLEAISKVCGTPCEANWPDVIKLSLYKNFKYKKHYSRIVKEHFKDIPAGALDLLDAMLTLDPKKRLSADEVCNHPWLINIDPRTIEPPKFPRNQDCHELWSKNQKRKKVVVRTNGNGAIPISPP